MLTNVALTESLISIVDLGFGIGLVSISLLDALSLYLCTELPIKHSLWHVLLFVKAIDYIVTVCVDLPLEPGNFVIWTNEQNFRLLDGKSRTNIQRNYILNRMIYLQPGKSVHFCDASFRLKGNTWIKLIWGLFHWILKMKTIHWKEIR